MAATPSLDALNKAIRNFNNDARYREEMTDEEAVELIKHWSQQVDNLFMLFKKTEVEKLFYPALSDDPLLLRHLNNPEAMKKALEIGRNTVREIQKEYPIYQNRIKLLNTMILVNLTENGLEKRLQEIIKHQRVSRDQLLELKRKLDLIKKFYEKEYVIMLVGSQNGPSSPQLKINTMIRQLEELSKLIAKELSPKIQAEKQRTPVSKQEGKKQEDKKDQTKNNQNILAILTKSTRKEYEGKTKTFAQRFGQYKIRDAQINFIDKLKDSFKNSKATPEQIAQMLYSAIDIVTKELELERAEHWTKSESRLEKVLDQEKKELKKLFPMVSDDPKNRENLIRHIDNIADVQKGSKVLRQAKNALLDEERRLKKKFKK